MVPRIAGAPPGQRFDRATIAFLVVFAVVIVGAVTWKLWSRANYPMAELTAPEMLSIERDRGITKTTEDDVLIERFSGDVDIAPDMVDAVSCLVAEQWLVDRALGPRLVIARNPTLVRAAELYAEAADAGDTHTARLIARTEAAIWDVDGDVDQLDTGRLGASDEQRSTIDTYLERRAEPPSQQATDRFVVIAAQQLRLVSGISYIDTHRLSPDVIAKPTRRSFNGHRTIAGVDETVSFDFGDCDDVADAWNRYDPDLPALPPIEDRVFIAPR